MTVASARGRTSGERLETSTSGPQFGAPPSGGSCQRTSNPLAGRGMGGGQALRPPNHWWRATHPTRSGMPGKDRKSTPPDPWVSTKVPGPCPGRPLHSPCAGDRSPVAAESRSARWLDRSVQAVHIPAREGGERPPRTRRREQAAGMGPQPDSNGHWPRVQRAVPGRRSRSLQAGRPACASVKPTRFGPTTGMDHRRPHHGPSLAATSCAHFLHLPWMACTRPPSPRLRRLR